MTAPNGYVWGGTHSIIDSTNLVTSDLDLENGNTPLLAWTNLDSHANEVLVCKNSVIVNHTGKRAEGAPFITDYDSLSQEPTSDAAIRCDFQLNSETYLLIFRNSLRLHIVGRNLLPLLVAR